MPTVKSSVKGKRPVRIGVAGCGQMGRKHAHNCSRIKGVSVVAVADKDMKRARALAGEMSAVPYSSAEALLAGVDVDALIVATPPDKHGKDAHAAIKAGKAVLVEKPIALDIATAKSLCVAAKKASVVNAVGFHLRYAPLTQKARSLIAGKCVTQVRSVTTTGYYLKMDMPAWFLQRKHSGGPLLEQSLHMFDEARYLVGDITRVFAQGDRLVRPELKRFDSEDTMVLAYRFANGALGTHADSCATTVFNWEIELFGTDWRLLIDYARKRLNGYFGEETIHIDFTDTDLHMLELQAFIDDVRNRRVDSILSNFRDATKTLEVMLAGDRSLKSGAWEPVGKGTR
ncbi:MAG: Gfo/Idh/MocA family oxidoreductase [Dehalococcoidales bacterium]|nr:Gfo/Idh/MocA family oxidoreductase [Dehalococcoidales bacterium]